MKMNDCLLAIAMMAFISSPALAVEAWKPVSGLATNLANYKTVYVTSLADSGMGSLRQVIQDNVATGPVIVKFKVGGIIKVNSKIAVRNNKGIIVDGSSAPAPGIRIENNGLSIRTSNTIVKHMTIRVGDRIEGGDGSDRDGIQVIADSKTVPIQNIVIQNNSIAWAMDEGISVVSNNARGILIQDNLIAEGLAKTAAEKGKAFNEPNHAFALMVGRGAKEVRVYRNLLVSHQMRAPQIGEASNVIVANNVVYNNAERALHYVGVKHSDVFFGPLKVDALYNYFISGPRTPEISIVRAGQKVKSLAVNTYPLPNEALSDGSALYHEGNAVGLRDKTVVDWVINMTKVRAFNKVNPLSSQRNFMDAGAKIDTNVTGSVLSKVLKNAGANPSRRDQTDKRVVAQVIARTGDFVSTPPASEFIR